MTKKTCTDCLQDLFQQWEHDKGTLTDFEFYYKYGVFLSDLNQRPKFAGVGDIYHD